jgi:hypothetical protein
MYQLFASHPCACPCISIGHRVLCLCACAPAFARAFVFIFVSVSVSAFVFVFVFVFISVSVYVPVFVFVFVYVGVYLLSLLSVSYPHACSYVSTGRGILSVCMRLYLHTCMCPYSYLYSMPSTHILQAMLVFAHVHVPVFVPVFHALCSHPASRACICVCASLPSPLLVSLSEFVVLVVCIIASGICALYPISATGASYHFVRLHAMCLLFEIDFLQCQQTVEQQSGMHLPRASKCSVEPRLRQSLDHFRPRPTRLRRCVIEAYRFFGGRARFSCVHRGGEASWFHRLFFFHSFRSGNRLSPLQEDVSIMVPLLT